MERFSLIIIIITYYIAIFRWDLSSIECLPQYMRIALKFFLNTSNELTAEVVKKQGRDMSAYIRKNAVCIVYEYRTREI